MCLINVFTHFCQPNSHLSTDLDFGSQARPNNIICNVKNLLPYPSPYPKGEIIWCRRHQYKRVFKIRQTVASTSITSQFHDCCNLIFVGFLLFCSTVRHWVKLCVGAWPCFAWPLARSIQEHSPKIFRQNIIG